MYGKDLEVPCVFGFWKVDEEDEEYRHPEEVFQNYTIKLTVLDVA